AILISLMAGSLYFLFLAQISDSLVLFCCDFKVDMFLVLIQ
ncbi:14350_t:CDS:1, partial [Gigaspora rosea]